jgi:hypothetical protein
MKASRFRTASTILALTLAGEELFLDAFWACPF